MDEGVRLCEMMGTMEGMTVAGKQARACEWAKVVRSTVDTWRADGGKAGTWLWGCITVWGAFVVIKDAAGHCEGCGWQGIAG